MKKILITFILLILFENLCIAQKDTLSLERNYKMNISISSGRAIPFGGFSKLENENSPYITQGGNIAGAASSGDYAKIDFNFKVFKQFGVSAMLYSSENKGETPTQNEFKPPYSTALGGGYNITSYSYNTNDWTTKAALVGVYTESSHKKISLILKLLLGVQQVKSPETHIYMEGYNWMLGQGTTSNFKSEIKQPSFISYNIVGNIGIESHYRFSKRLKAKIGIESFLSQAAFDGKLEYTKESKFNDGSTIYYQDKSELHFTKNVFIICLNAGFVFDIF